jgi:hypothetical protein
MRIAEELCKVDSMCDAFTAKKFIENLTCFVAILLVFRLKQNVILKVMQSDFFEQLSTQATYSDSLVEHP